MSKIYKPELVADDMGNGVKEWLIKKHGTLAFTEEEKKACKIRTYPNGLKITKWRDSQDPEKFVQTTFSNEQGKKDREIISLSEQGNTETKTTEMKEKFNKSAFNSQYEHYSGTNAKIFVENILDKAVTNNKTNKDMLITVIYKDKETTDPDTIVEIKHSLNDRSKYEVKLDYDDDGYVNKITLEDI